MATAAMSAQDIKTSEMPKSFTNGLLELYPKASDIEREQTANSITSFRMLQIDYLEKTIIASDSIRSFSNEIFYLENLGISSRQFLEDSYNYRDGIIENVPIGDTYAVTAGSSVHLIQIISGILQMNQYCNGTVRANVLSILTVKAIHVHIDRDNKMKTQLITIKMCIEIALLFGFPIGF